MGYSAFEIVASDESARPVSIAAAGFLLRGEGMAKRGRPPKQDAKRKPCGRLASSFDEGHPMVLQRRADEVGAEQARSKYASYVIGRLLITGKLHPEFDRGNDRAREHAFERAERRHDVLVEFATMHFRLFGSGTAPSHLRNAVAGMTGPAVAGDNDPNAGLYAKYKVWYSAAMILPPGKSRVLVHQILERAALYEMAPANAAELECLIRVADRFLDFKRAAGEDKPRRGSSAAPSTRSERRRERMLAIYSRDRFGPDDDELAAALAKMRPAGEAD